MEDLKKQTALRLAKEQQQGLSGSDFHDGRSSTKPFRAATATPEPKPSTDSFRTPPPTADRVFPPTATNMATPVRHASHQRLFTSNEVMMVRSAPRPTLSESGKTNKLPHGLTVHELKEMTKARLQAEASDKRDLPTPEPRIPAVIRADNFREASPTAPSPVPNNNWRAISRSPYPTADSNSSFGQHLDNRSIDSSRNDGWETGSVNTQTSEYFGSEHAFASFDTDHHPMNNRARSLSANSGFPPPQQDFEATSQSFYSEPAGFAPNRRRAATLSPRAGLSHLHEDRPVLLQQSIPGLPSFQHTTPTLARRIPPRTAYTPDRLANRARTHSAVSLPADQLDDSDALFQQQQQSVTGLSTVFRDQRMRASTWAPDNDHSLFPDLGLSEDLASILKLSGAEEKD